MNGATHAMQGEIVPSWDALLIDKDPYNGNVCNWSFNQEGRVSVDRESRVIKHDVSDHKTYACDQNRNPNKKLWDLLLDNQSTCDLIINS